MALFQIEWTIGKGIIGSLTAVFALGAAFFGLLNGYDKFCHFGGDTWLGKAVCEPIEGSRIMATPSVPAKQ
jgi:hypothetical protein